METKPEIVSRLTSQIEASSRLSRQGEKQGIEKEEPFALIGPSNAFIGLVIAIATVGAPLLAVLTERPMGRESVHPTALESDGSKAPSPVSLTRIGQSRRGDSRRQ